MEMTIGSKLNTIIPTMLGSINGAACMSVFHLFMVLPLFYITAS